MYRYQTLDAWKRSHAAVLLTFRSTDEAYHPRARPVFEQLRRAALSVEANIVEGYALGTVPLCRRHLRIAFGSAAEAECLVRTARELDYLSDGITSELEGLLGDTMRALHGLMRSPPIIHRRSASE